MGVSHLIQSYCGRVSDLISLAFLQLYSRSMDMHSARLKMNLNHLMLQPVVQTNGQKSTLAKLTANVLRFDRLPNNGYQDDKV